MKKAFLLTVFAEMLCFTAWAQEQEYAFRGIRYYIDEDKYEVSTGTFDLNGGKDGYAWFTLRYEVSDEGDKVILETDLFTHDTFEKAYFEPESVVAMLRFKDGSSVKPDDSRFCDDDVVYRGYFYTYIMCFDAGRSNKTFTSLRSKDISWLGRRNGERFPLGGFAGSSASVIDNLCHLMEVAGFIPEGLLGKSPHHHFSIDKELNCDNPKYHVGDRMTIDGHEGIICEVSECGTHGRIISVECSDDLKFHTGVHKAFGNYSYNNGKANCAAIMAIRGWEKSFPALAWCKSLGPSWYLPSSTELGRGLYYLKMAELTDDSNYLFNTSSYGFFDLNEGDIDFSPSNDIDGLIYTAIPTYAVAAF